MPSIITISLREKAKVDIAYFAHPRGFDLLSLSPAIYTCPAVSTRPRRWLVNVNIANIFYRSLFCFHCHRTQLSSELLKESLVGHAVLLHALHEFSVQKVGICGSNVQEVKKEFPVSLHSSVLCGVVLD